MAAKTYSSDTYDCFADPGVCIFTFLCTPCQICALAEKLGATETHGCCPYIKSVCATSCWMCALCCCIDDIFPCFMTRLLKKSMEKHGITVPPPPCGDAGCAGCWWQMFLPCTMSCTLCLMVREANKQ